MKNKKTLFTNLVLISMFLISIVACKKTDDTVTSDPVITPKPTSTTVTMGAQFNTTYGGFYSVGTKTSYTMNSAFQNQSAIDLLCFYEAASGNNITVASPGSNITGIFTGTSSVENWTTKKTTRFTKTSF